MLPLTAFGADDLSSSDTQNVLLEGEAKRLYSESLTCIETRVRESEAFQSNLSQQAREDLILDNVDSCITVLTDMINAINDTAGAGEGIVYFKQDFLPKLVDVMGVRLWRARASEVAEGVQKDNPHASDGKGAFVLRDRDGSDGSQTDVREEQTAQGSDFKAQNGALNACVLKAVNTYLNQNEPARMVAETAYGVCKKQAGQAYIAYLKTLKKTPQELSKENAKKYQNYFHGKKIESYARYVIDQRAKRGVQANTIDAAAPAPGPKNIKGSGFIISKSGFALTNYHVIKTCKRIQTNQGIANAILQDPNNDIAVIKVKRPPADKHKDFAALSFRKSGLNLGETVYAVGYPLQDVLQNGLNLTSGDVSSLAGPNNDVRFVGVSAPIQPGNSGGALLDEYGRVVAMTTSKLSDMKILKSSGSLPQNVGFALRQDLLKMVLSSNNIVYDEAGALFSKDPEKMTDSAREAMLQISCDE